MAVVAKTSTRDKYEMVQLREKQRQSNNRNPPPITQGHPSLVAQ
jgi:hypothetical protein